VSLEENERRNTIRATLTIQNNRSSAAMTVKGAATMVLETGLHPGQLKDNVMSPGGTTAAGVHALEDGGVRSALIGAVVAASTKATEMGKK